MNRIFRTSFGPLTAPHFFSIVWFGWGTAAPLHHFNSSFGVLIYITLGRKAFTTKGNIKKKFLTISQWNIFHYKSLNDRSNYSRCSAISMCHASQLRKKFLLWKDTFTKFEDFQLPCFSREEHVEKFFWVELLCFIWQKSYYCNC